MSHVYHVADVARRRRDKLANHVRTYAFATISRAWAPIGAEGGEGEMARRSSPTRRRPTPYLHLTILLAVALSAIPASEPRAAGPAAGTPGAGTGTVGAG